MRVNRHFKKPNVQNVTKAAATAWCGQAAYNYPGRSRRGQWQLMQSVRRRSSINSRFSSVTVFLGSCCQACIADMAVKRTQSVLSPNAYNISQSGWLICVGITCSEINF